jgi:hypothetical protein
VLQIVYLFLLPPTLVESSIACIFPTTELPAHIFPLEPGIIETVRFAESRDALPIDMRQAQKTYEIEGRGFAHHEAVVVVGGGKDAESVQDYIDCSGKIVGVTNTRPRWFLVFLDDQRQIAARPHHIEPLRAVHGARQRLYDETLDRFFLSNDFAVYISKAEAEQEGFLYLTLYPDGTWAALTQEERDGGRSAIELLFWKPEGPLDFIKEYLRDRLRYIFENLSSAQQNHSLD